MPAPDSLDRRPLPIVATPKGRMTEREARVVGAAANRIVNLRGLLKSASGSATLSVTTTGGQVAIVLPQGDAEAVLALLIERDSTLLASFDIALDSN